ncbi:ABC transporter permease [Jannaschia sp. LMIT008]|uniref:ABC transporter permease n=1 Tax=Jannaschia maritima TaxID=3032585 RepID=UPI0028128CB5|nr:ABC transporter permease [Jannaschia sp. LMIT008]
MIDLWLALPAWAQDLAILLALTIVPAIMALLVLRGYAPGALIRAVLRRFGWTNAAFVALIAVSVGLGVGLIAQERGLRQGTAQAADKFDLIVAAPGSEMTMMLASVFLQPSNVALIDGPTYAEIATHPQVRIAAPLAFGDSWEDAPVVGTTGEFARHLSDDRIEGRTWQAWDEAVAGAFVPLAVGDRFLPAHGLGDAAEEGVHADEATIVGRMAPTGTPWDRAILVPVEFVWVTHGLYGGMPPEPSEIGPPFDPERFPGTPAVIVRADELWANYALRSEFTREAETMAFFPGAVLAGLYRVMGDVRQAMSIMALVTQGLVAASVLLGLVILMRLFRRQVALLRALGAPGRFVLAVIWSYGAALIAAGAVMGLGVGWVAAELLSRIVTARTDILVVARLGWPELHLVAGFLCAATVLLIVPAFTVLRQPVVKGLRA